MVVLCMLFLFHASAAVLHVDSNSTNSVPPYASWSTAAANIQDAIDVSTNGDLVLVTNGNYQTGGRVVYGSLMNRVAITKAVTVQSVNGPSATVIRGYLFIGDTAVRCVYMTNNATLSGFTLTWGATRSAGDVNQEESGGGIWCEDTSATISNCVIVGNSAYISGGGVISGTLNNCTINGNAASKIGGESMSGTGGGALYSALNRCSISGNSAFAGGGVAYGTLNYCTVSGNAATAPFNSGNYFLTGGGGVLNGVANNCKITRNSAYVGGGFYGLGSPGGVLNNCLVANNFVNLAYGGIGGTFDGTLNNCTIVGNAGGQVAGSLGGTLNNCIVYYNGSTNFDSVTMNNCCTAPMPASGTGNFTNAPMFVNPANEFHLLPVSPCIDAGNGAYVTVTNDLDGNARIVGSTVDIGAYEYQDRPIFIITQPSSQTNTIGQTVLFNVLATSPQALNYYWQFNNAGIPGATNSSLTLTNIQLTNSGVYSVILSNSLETLGSSNAVLTVNYPPPAILAQPTNLTVFVGSNAAFSATVLTYSPAGYRWYFNGTPLADDGRVTGSGTTNLTIADVETNDAGPYQLVATNDYGSAGSAQATLTVLPVTTVGVQPQNLTTNGGATVTFTSTVAGQGPFTYQWQFNGTNLPGATTSNLTLTNALDSQSGAYALVVGNAAGSVVSFVASLTVVPWVTATIQPGTVISGSGFYVTFTTTSGGFSSNTVYQWQLNSTNLVASWSWTNGDSVIYLLPSIADAGVYDVVASDAYTNVTSSNAVLNVTPLAITAQPQSQSVLGGAKVTFSVVAPGEQPVTYRWQYDSTDIPDATNSSLVLSNVLVSQSGTYSVIVTNAYATVVSSNATLTVSPVAFTAQPTNRVAWLGGSTFFKVNVAGQPPFNFDWQYNGADIPVTVSNVLTLTNLQASQFGPYDVIVSNSYGSVTSSIATLLFSEVAVWGYGVNGETNLPAGLTNIMAISCGTPGPIDCLALKSNGTIIEWPGSPSSYVTAEVTNLLAIASAGAAGPNLGLKSDGTVISWVYDSPLPVYGLTNIAAIVPRYGGYLALKTNGTLADVGLAGAPPAIVTNLTNVVAISQGYQHGIALQADGIVSAWGNNSFGQTNIPAGLSNVVAIAAGGYHTLALKSDGTVVAWGRIIEHQAIVPSGLSNVVAIAAGGYHSLALKSDGTVVAWGMNVYGQTNIPAGLTNVIAIAAGEYDSLALIGNGPPATQAPLSNPNLDANGFSVSLPTRSGKVYVLQYENSLSDSNWTSLPLVPGNGSTTLLTDPTATNSQRFYRVQQW